MSKGLGKGKARRRGRGLRRGKRGLAEPFWRPREYRRAAREASGKVARAGMTVDELPSAEVARRFVRAPAGGSIEGAPFVGSRNLPTTRMFLRCLLPAPLLLLLTVVRGPEWLELARR